MTYFRDSCGNLYGAPQQQPELQTLEFTVWDSGADEMPEHPGELAAWLLTKLELIPAEFRETAAFNDECHGDGDYGYDHERSITYTRLETPAEAQKRVTNAAKQNAAERKRAEARERAVLAQLQAKYGPSS
jgi:hypothetical protein